MDTKLKKWKKTFSFIAFFLGISILLGNLSSLFVRYSSVDVLKKDVSSAFSGDYQTTDEFRYYVSDYLERFLVMASAAISAAGIITIMGIQMKSMKAIFIHPMLQLILLII